MADAGLSPMESIIAGTRDAAAAMGVSDRIGTIEPGKAADLLVVEGDPSHNLADLRKVLAVFRAGRKISGSGNSPSGTPE
jgi:imidazolonepropionase-like amidohydrolase